ncbi:hypothetical protein OL548_03515 [Lysinibacillus sp. MHQ-1]|nr:hypothetical protein OL548_03515 [Lysinibacillus sp. MHQ-1]
MKYTPEDFLQIWTGVLVLLVPSIKFERGDETQGLFARFFHLLKPQKMAIFFKYLFVLYCIHYLVLQVHFIFNY